MKTLEQIIASLTKADAAAFDAVTPSTSKQFDWVRDTFAASLDLPIRDIFSICYALEALTPAGLAVTKRKALERRAVRHLIRTAKKHGYAVTKVWDGEESVKCKTETEALDTVFSVDESTIYFKHPAEDKAHCAVIVLGNSGWEAIADHSEGGLWDAVMSESSEYADKLEAA